MPAIVAGIVAMGNTVWGVVVTTSYRRMERRAGDVRRPQCVPMPAIVAGIAAMGNTVWGVVVTTSYRRKEANGEIEDVRQSQCHRVTSGVPWPSVVTDGGRWDGPMERRRRHGDPLHGGVCQAGDGGRHTTGGRRLPYRRKEANGEIEDVRRPQCVPTPAIGGQATFAGHSVC